MPRRLVHTSRKWLRRELEEPVRHEANNRLVCLGKLRTALHTLLRTTATSAVTVMPMSNSDVVAGSDSGGGNWNPSQHSLLGRFTTSTSLREKRFSSSPCGDPSSPEERGEAPKQSAASSVGKVNPGAHASSRTVVNASSSVGNKKPSPSQATFDIGVNASHTRHHNAFEPSATWLRFDFDFRGSDLTTNCPLD